MTCEQLAEIRNRVEKTANGPWSIEDGEVQDSEGCAVAWLFQDSDSPGNGDFIAHARADIPALIEEVERLRGVLESIIARHDRGDKQEACCEMADRANWALLEEK